MSRRARVCVRCGAAYGEDVVLCPVDGQPLREQRDPLIGQTVAGRYRLISRLGAGGMASVYLARHVLIGRQVAVKTLRRDLAKDPVQRDRFMREARAVGRIHHPNVVEVNDYGTTPDGVLYLVMEFVPGDPLLRLMDQGPMAVDRALFLCRQIALGLSSAHEIGVVHRDLKPDNILVMQNGGRDRLKILDFGIAKVLDAPSLTGSQQIFGTPGYIAPEYIQSTEIDGRADLYSLGVVLYELVTSAMPFDYEYPGDLLVKHVTEPPIPPSRWRADLPAELEAFILQCLAKDPAERFRDAYHFLDGLDQVCDSLGCGRQTPLPTPVPPNLRAEHDEAVRRLDQAVAMAPPTEEKVWIPTPPEAVSPERSAGTEALGPAGVLRWRERFDVLDVLVRDDDGRVIDALLADRLEQARQTLVSLESCVAEIAEVQRKLEALTQDARDFRVTLGRAIDRLARAASAQERKQSDLAAQRAGLRHRRLALSGGQAETSQPSVETDSDEGAMAAMDELLWEEAAVAQELNERRAEQALVEGQLAALRRELALQNEIHEEKTAAAVLASEAGLLRADRLAEALRIPLNVVEEAVRASWPVANR